MTEAFLNRTSTALPPNAVHTLFQDFARGLLADKPRERALFDRMARRSGITERWSVLSPSTDLGRSLDRDGRFRPGGFPTTGTRMALYEATAHALARRAVEGLDADPATITHLIVTSCTGFYAPGLDLDLVASCGLNPAVERTIIGFMGCHAGFNALRQARHIVRSEPAAKVVIVSLELCTLHVQETDDLERILSFLLFGDGCGAALVSATPVGLRLDRSISTVAVRTSDLIRWGIRDQGFDMVLSGKVPGAIGELLASDRARVMGGLEPREIDVWAVHPGGRSILDVVEQSLELDATALDHSRAVLAACGNMSSATILFVLDRVLRTTPRGQLGCALGFGPGLTTETLIFRT